VTPEKLSALLSLLAALAVAIASFFKWFSAAGMFETRIQTRPWVKVMFGVVSLILIVAIVLLFLS